LILIILPLSKPVLATIALFYAVFYWNDWFSAMLYLNSSEKWPVMLFLRDIVSGVELAIFGSGGIVTRPRDLGLVPTSMRAAAILIVILPIVTVYPFIQKYFVSGVMLGSVKE
jgi:putative aldouronate transport system permease protein